MLNTKYNNIMDGNNAVQNMLSNLDNTYCSLNILKGNEMKLWKLKDGFLLDPQTDEEVAEVFIDWDKNGKTQICVFDKNNIPNYLKTQNEFGFASINEFGYYEILTAEFRNLI